MAVKHKQETLYTKKPDLNSLKELSIELNSISLPNIPDNPQILLPPPEYSLIRNNFQVYSEDILHNVTSCHTAKQDSNIEEEFGLIKRHSMIGLKRQARDCDSFLNKKKIRLSTSHNDELYSEINENYNKKKFNKSGRLNLNENNINGSINLDSEKHNFDEDYEKDIFDNEEESVTADRNNNFYINNDHKSDEEDYLYDSNFP